MVVKRLLATALILLPVLALSGCLSFFSSDSKSSGGGKVSSPKKATATSEEVKAQLSKAAGFMMQGDYNNAMPELMKAREMDPRNADVENFFGLAYYGMKSHNQAIDSFKKALSFDSNRPDVHNNLGLAYLALQQYDPALQEFNTCLASPDYQKRHLPLSNIGLTYLETGRYDQALEALTRATEENPNYAKAYQLMGRVYLTKGNAQSAMNALDTAMRLDPNDPETNALYNDARSRLGRR